ncbi:MULTISPECIES: ATP-binding protein [Helcococcus]|uniref:ATP-binding protein n=1 Tax=Helcococcus bovis TaxID=3153252 RepID=A0ABW9F489_9FIRM
MKNIYRKKYIDEISKFIDKPVIKILVGMRRVGKSTLLEIIKDEILKDVGQENKFFINFESYKFSKIKNYNMLMEYISENISNNGEKNYFFFDEIQLVENWEKAINSIRVDYDSDIYITGSNSSLLSGDLSSLLAGRYVEFEIKPFVFSEFKELYSNLGYEKYELFDKFIQFGGMPFLKYFDLQEDPSFKYLKDVYNTVIVKDVLEYNKVRDVDLFKRILNYAIDNLGQTFSALSIKKYLKNELRTVSIDTILNYLEFCVQAFILNKVQRYDYVGKKILKVEEKYYLNDHGFREAIGLSNFKNIERVLENIVYNELIFRGYEVKIGKVNNFEIDFIAKRNKEIKYFQVSYLLESESTRDREFGVYNLIQDNYPKYVLSMDNKDFSQNGIIHKNIVEFLLDYRKTDYK